MFAAAFGGCASGEPQNLKILKGDEKERACARAYERIRSLEAEFLAAQNPYANPSVANEHISKSDELERTVRDTIKLRGRKAAARFRSDVASALCIARKIRRVRTPFCPSRTPSACFALDGRAS